MPCLQVSKTSYPDTVIEAFNLSTPLIHIQPRQEFLSNLRSILGQHNLLLLELMAPLSSMSTAANYLLLTNPPKIWFFFFILSISWVLVHSLDFLGINSWLTLVVTGKVWICRNTLSQERFASIPITQKLLLICSFTNLNHKPLYGWEYFLYIQTWVLPYQLAAASQIYTSVTEVRGWPHAMQAVLLEELNGKRQHAEMEARSQRAARCWKNLSEPQ